MINNQSLHLCLYPIYIKKNKWLCLVPVVTQSSTVPIVYCGCFFFFFFSPDSIVALLVENV